jgi:predicted transposase YbfD/YdcC
MDYNNVPLHQEISETGLIYDVGSLYDHLMKINDPRDRRGLRYRLINLMVMTLLAKLAGENTPSGIADWVAERLDLLIEMQVTDREQAPSHMTFRRMLQWIISVERLEEVLREYQKKALQSKEELVLSMDGKTLRGTIPTGDTRGVHLLAVYVPKQGLVLAQVAVGKKENEITQAPELLKQVCLQGAIVLGDAMQTQRELSQQIVDAQGDFIWKVKGNQAKTEWAIRKLFVEETCHLQKGQPLSRECQMGSTLCKGHGRIETRTLLTSTALNGYLDWPALAQVFRLQTVIRYPNGSKTVQISYGLTSLTAEEASPTRLLTLIRHYWGIESCLHYRRDVTLQEDATRFSVPSAAQNMAAFNNLVIHLALPQGTGNLPKALRHFNAKPADALKRICSLPSTL